MKLKAIYITALTLAMVATQACAVDARHGEDSGGHHGMHGSQQGMDMGMDKGMGMGMSEGGHKGMHHGYSGHGGAGSDLMEMAEFDGIHRLHLNDEQRKKFRAIKHQLKKDLWALMGKMIDVKESLHQLWDVDKPDAATVGAAYKDMFDLERQAIELRVTARNAIYDILNQEQREQFRSGHRGGHHGGGHH